MSEHQELDADGAEQVITESSEPKRRPYETPRLESGDIFERIVVSSGSEPTVEFCN